MKKKFVEKFNNVLLWLVTICAICALFTTTHYVIDTYNDNTSYTVNLNKSN